ncbi:MAG: 5-oxoprolinase subunit PxpB [Oscillospiraceae bacterium]|nr:5-oxoprolinase subunit PxpB [Candidatus Equicaccousia limihippi]
MSYPKIKITGDTSVAVVFGNVISEEINTKIRAFERVLDEANIDGIYENVPTYCSVTVHYAPEKIRYGTLCEKLEEILAKPQTAENVKTTVMEIPVLYGGEHGPDLEYVARHNGLTPDEVIDIHTGAEYLIYMLGFTPGFSYMGGMDERIATPRLKTPRVVIPAGSVGIAGKQTGIYPIDSPGGWQLIGRTPVKLYDAHRETPILTDAGLHVKFFAIDRKEYDRIAALETENKYRCHTFVKEEL